jgi:hypothetical protein
LHRFTARLLRPAKSGAGDSWGFAVLPKDVSGQLPRRGRTTVAGTINGKPFQQTLEPDGNLSHWLLVDHDLQRVAKTSIGEVIALELRPVAQEPEPAVPADLQEALQAVPEAHRTWNDTTTIARVDWIHWISSAKQAKTRDKRIRDAMDKLAAGQKRVCCFDPSGYYSKALRAPDAAV